MTWYYFKTFREKENVLKQLRKWNAVPFIKYALYRFRLSHVFHLKRKWYTMRVFYAPYAFWLWTHEDKEKDEELFFESFLKEGDTVVDCGAHLGTLTITASKLVGEHGRVYAYEAHPKTFSYLMQNVKDNNCQNVSLGNYAIGEKEKDAMITNSYVSDMNTVCEEGELSVNMKTLDSLLLEVQEVTLLKLDVEGSELPALFGAQTLLPKVKAIYFESAQASFDRFSYSLKDIVSFLEQRGFSCFSVSGSSIGKKIDKTHTTKSRYENILALRS